VLDLAEPKFAFCGLTQERTSTSATGQGVGLKGATGSTKHDEVSTAVNGVNEARNESRESNRSGLSGCLRWFSLRVRLAARFIVAGPEVFE